MADLLLWRRLTKTDFESINGRGAKAKTGGGAMHISLGKDKRTRISIGDFLSSKGRLVTIETEALAPRVPKAALTFDGNPDRRGGDWRINDQFRHRHPAWKEAQGFPKAFDPSNRPLAFVVRIEDKYHVRLSDERRTKDVSPTLFGLIAATQNNTGILPFDPAWAPVLAVPSLTGLLGDYQTLATEMEAAGIDTFDPADIKDGRRKILAEVIRRQGQRTFRRKLIKAYGKCVVTRTSFALILEAAHITPYRGRDTNNTSNGLLLRGDVHTLFDLGLITIEANTYRIRVSSDLVGTDYMAFNNKKIKLPKDIENRPSDAALKEHNKLFRA